MNWDIVVKNAKKATGFTLSSQSFLVSNFLWCPFLFAKSIDLSVRFSWNFELFDDQREEFLKFRKSSWKQIIRWSKKIRIFVTFYPKSKLVDSERKWRSWNKFRMTGAREYWIASYLTMTEQRNLDSCIRRNDRNSEIIKRANQIRTFITFYLKR